MEMSKKILDISTYSRTEQEKNSFYFDTAKTFVESFGVHDVAEDVQLRRLIHTVPVLHLGRLQHHQELHEGEQAGVPCHGDVSVDLLH